MDKSIWTAEKKLLKLLEKAESAEEVKTITEGILNLSIASDTINTDYFEIVEEGITTTKK